MQTIITAIDLSIFPDSNGIKTDFNLMSKLDSGKYSFPLISKNVTGGTKENRNIAVRVVANLPTGATNSSVNKDTSTGGLEIFGWPGSPADGLSVEGVFTLPLANTVEDFLQVYLKFDLNGKTYTTPSKKFTIKRKVPYYDDPIFNKDFLKSGTGLISHGIVATRGTEYKMLSNKLTNQTLVFLYNYSKTVSGTTENPDFELVNTISPNFGVGAVLQNNVTSSWSIKPKTTVASGKTVFIEFLLLDPYVQPVIARTTFTVN